MLIAPECKMATIYKTGLVKTVFENADEISVYLVMK